MFSIMRRKIKKSFILNYKNLKYTKINTNLNTKNLKNNKIILNINSKNTKIILNTKNLKYTKINTNLNTKNLKNTKINKPRYYYKYKGLNILRNPYPLTNFWNFLLKPLFFWFIYFFNLFFILYLRSLFIYEFVIFIGNN